MRYLNFLLVLLVFTSCNNNKGSEKKQAAADTPYINKSKQTELPPGSSIIGRWKTVELSMPMSAEKKKEILETATLEFTDSGKYISTVGADRETGTYIYNQSANTLVTTAPGKTGYKYITSWYSGLLTLSTREGSVVLQRQ
ncbi:MAG TPA: hypothetical protein VMZ03_13330 [Chitinophagaceae bacterium]|nr:hypothetical protein [Chitinophagaceae bacterium]